MVIFVIPVITALVVGVLAIPVVRWLSFRSGKISHPRDDRWHTRPTPTLGGIAIFLGCAGGLLTVFIDSKPIEMSWPLPVAAVLMFFLGLYDDFKQINPVSKLIGQLAAAVIVIFWGGLVIRFFPWPIANILLTIFWLVGITNGINLLDNMDGIAGGVAMIAAGVLGVQFWLGGDLLALWMALALAGSTLSFLLFNFPPARIFMGDSGSMFLGFMLASLAIVRSQQASNVFAVVAVPVMIFLAPILDTTLVTLTRVLRGQSPTKGGTDHTTHRLVAFGLKPAQVAWVLYGVSLVGGVSGLLIEMMDYELSLILIPVILVSLALLTAYLGGVKVLPDASTERGSLAHIAVNLVFKRSLIELLLDVTLISISYYLGFWTQYGLDMTTESMRLFMRSWPAAIVMGLAAFRLFGVYRSLWGHLNVYYLLRLVGAILTAVICTAVALIILDGQAGYPPGVWVMYLLYLLFSAGGARASFYILDHLFRRQYELRTPETKQHVLIYGTGSWGEFAVRWLAITGQYTIVGFIEDDQRLWGRTFYEYPIMGGADQLTGLIDSHHVDGIVASSEVFLRNPGWTKITQVCETRGIWTCVLHIQLEPAGDERLSTHLD